MSEKKIDQPALQKLFEKACMLDIRSLKPGNVNTNSPSKNLNYLDFLKTVLSLDENFNILGRNQDALKSLHLIPLQPKISLS